MSELWRTSAGMSPARGFSEYAHQKADMFARRSQDTVDRHKEALAAVLDVTGKGKGKSCTCLIMYKQPNSY